MELRVNKPNVSTAVIRPDSASQRHGAMSPTPRRTPSWPLPPILPHDGEGDQATLLLLQHGKSEVEEAMKQLRIEVSTSSVLYIE